MDNTTKNNGTLLLRGDKSPSNRGNQPPDTPQSSAYSLDFYQKITKALFPYTLKDEAVETSINDNHGFLLDSLISQAELLRDLGGKTQGNEDIDGHGLAGYADSLIRQLDILAVVQGEYHTQVTARNTRQKNRLTELAQVVDTLKAENRALKGGAV